MIYPTHLYIVSKIPSYSKGKKNSCKKKIIETMKRNNYDDDEFIQHIDYSFCEGFGVAKDIIFNLLEEEYWKQRKIEQP